MGIAGCNSRDYRKSTANVGREKKIPMLNKFCTQQSTSTDREPDTLHEFTKCFFSNTRILDVNVFFIERVEFAFQINAWNLKYKQVKTFHVTVDSVTVCGRG